ncbi:MAG TPA: c-type cytochrome domain-containing protein, partial [Lacipirellulaceae bacterium]|nr:c-type cytochrome domain-containing protein [Lacipirellulaceae bacterium]
VVCLCGRLMMANVRLPKYVMLATLVLVASVQSEAAESKTPDFNKDVAPIFAKYCAGCHNDTDLEGGLSLESFAKLQKGGEKGAVVVPQRSDASLMIRMLTGEVEPSMPPEDNPHPTATQINIIRAWIDAGAKGPDGKQSDFPELSTPKIAAAPGVKEYITSLALSPDGKQLALGRYRQIELVNPTSRQVIARVRGLPGKVNRICYSREGRLFVAASGIPALYGVAMVCKASDGSVVSQIKGQRDILYDAKLSPDGKLLATCSYDHQICLWDVATGKLVRTLTGHNGAVYELAFSSDGSVLASASADATVKLWNVATGERLDTLGQPEGEQCAVAFSPDGKSIVAGGGDRELRLWQFLSRKRPEINPLKFSRTAHESAIVDFAFSPDGSKLVSASEGGELVLWDVADLKPTYRFKTQPDVISGLAFEPNGAGIYVACINGSWQRLLVPRDIETVAAKTNKQATTSSATAADEKVSRAVYTEHEPNNSASSANVISANSVTSGVISAPGQGALRDVDLFRFHAHRGERLVLEINGARTKSPLDSKLEILDATGKRVPRVVLQAVRTSYFTFRGHNSTDLSDFRLSGFADMELNQYVYANGEVMKLWMQPRGPDSGFLVYPGFSGERYTYFGTTAITHALNETCYIVEPHRPGESLIPTGLPQYTIYYENDDDPWRKLGRDSRIAFTAPADGDYLARVSDVRGEGGANYKYQLIVRPPHPDFQISFVDNDRTINAGSGKEFSVVATRDDEFDGEIRVDVTGLPPGFHVTSPLTVEAGQTTAYGTLTANVDAPAPTSKNANGARVIASAVINGKLVTKKPIEFGEIKLAGRPQLLIRVLPASPAGDALRQRSATNQAPTELSVAPGETIAAVVQLERNGYDGDVQFGTEFAGRNLPHGVYVDNIGLNGMTLLKGETERTFYLTARKWVPEQTRLFHLRSEEAGNQTSWPVILHVRKGPVRSTPNANRVAASPETK